MTATYISLERSCRRYLKNSSVYSGDTSYISCKKTYGVLGRSLEEEEDPYMLGYAQFQFMPDLHFHLADSSRFPLLEG